MPTLHVALSFDQRYRHSRDTSLGNVHWRYVTTERYGRALRPSSASFFDS